MSRNALFICPCSDALYNSFRISLYTCLLYTSSHEICSGYRTQCDGVVVCSFITHNTYGTHVGQRCEVLVYFFVQASFGDFFTPDGICILYHLYFFCGYIADDTDTEPRTREWLTEYQVIRNAKFQTGFSYFVFEQVTQRLDDFFEIYMLRQTTYVVMRFDYGCLLYTSHMETRLRFFHRVFHFQYEQLKSVRKESAYLSMIQKEK